MPQSNPTTLNLTPEILHQIVTSAVQAATSAFNQGNQPTKTEKPKRPVISTNISQEK